MITAQRNNIVGTTFRTFFFLQKNKTLTANQNPFCFKKHKHSKWQSTKLKHVLIINRMLPCIGVDANVVIVLSFLV